MKKILYLPIETKQRELSSRLLITYFAVARGYNVIIGRKSLVEAYAKKNGNGIIVMKSSYNTNLFDETQLKIILNDIEGVVFDTETAYLRRLFFSISNFDKILVAGKLQREIISKHTPYASKCEIIGEPRFDLLRTEFDQIDTSSEAVDYKSYSPYIFVPTSLARVNLRKQSTGAKSYKEHLIRVNDSRDFTELDRTLERLNVVKVKTVELLLLLAKEESTRKIIIRPHPDEDIKYWLSKFKKYSNVIITQIGNSIDWIKHSELVIFNRSTVGLEAVLLGKLAINFLPFINKDNEYCITEKIGLMANSVEEGKKFVDYVLDGNKFSLNSNYSSEKMIREYVNFDNSFASENLLDSLDKLPYPIDINYSNNLGSNFLFLLRLSKISLILYVYNFVYSLDNLFERIFSIRPCYAWSSRIQKLTKIRKTDLVQAFDDYESIERLSHGLPIKVKQLIRDTYIVYVDDLAE